MAQFFHRQPLAAPHKNAFLAAGLLALLEVALLYAVIRAAGTALRASGLHAAETQALGWSYTGMILFTGLPALLVWVTRRRWADYGISLAGWPTHLDIGIQSYLVAFIPVVLGLGGTALLGMDYRSLPGGLLIAAAELAAIAVIIQVLRRQRPVESGRQNLVILAALLAFPILLAVAMGKLSVLIVSTVVWQFVFSGFCEEFVWRGYVQSRLNQAFGRPFQIYGIQFGPGLILASLLFGLSHAFNTYNPAAGQYELAWGWALWTTFSGLLFGILREKTGSLLAPGVAHGLPDAVGEALARIFGWM